MRKNDRAEIGRTGLRVNRLGLGGAPLAGLYQSVTDEGAAQVVNTYLDHGLGFFDTAPLYGSGVSETRLGAVLSERVRDTFVLATKVGRLLVPDPARDQDVWSDDLPPVGPVFDYSYDGTMRSLDESLERSRAGPGGHPPHSRSRQPLRRGAEGQLPGPGKAYGTKASSGPSASA